MNNSEFNFSFEDRFVSKFSFDLEEYIIEIFFNGYTDRFKEKSVDKPSLLTISGWKMAESKNWNDTKWTSIEDYLGIIKMVLEIKYNGKTLEMNINNINDKYVSLRFTDAFIEFNEISNKTI